MLGFTLEEEEEHRSHGVVGVHNRLVRLSSLVPDDRIIPSRCRRGPTKRRRLERLSERHLIQEHRARRPARLTRIPRRLIHRRRAVYPRPETATTGEGHAEGGLEDVARRAGGGGAERGLALAEGALAFSAVVEEVLVSDFGFVLAVSVMERIVLDDLVRVLKSRRRTTSLPASLEFLLDHIPGNMPLRDLAQSRGHLEGDLAARLTAEMILAQLRARVAHQARFLRRSGARIPALRFPGFLGAAMTVVAFGAVGFACAEVF